jgi:DNA-binding NarL/FixJ family response regulator
VSTAEVALVGVTPMLAARVSAALRRAGMAVTDSTTDPVIDSVTDDPSVVLVAAAPGVEAAVDACRPLVPAVVVAEEFAPPAVRRAVKLGVLALVPATDAGLRRLGDGVLAARQGDGCIPHDLLLRALGDDPSPDPAPATPLTTRQTDVLRMMADGYGNAAIARALTCSEHTVKNVVYELMGRLQSRNRAHAVGCAVRTGLI